MFVTNDVVSLGCPTGTQSQFELGLTKGTNPSPKKGTTLVWDNPIPTGSPKGTSQRRVPTAIFGLYKELPLICNIIFLDPFSHTSHSHLGSKEHVIILLSLPVGGFGSCLDLSQLWVVCPNLDGSKLGIKAWTQIGRGCDANEGRCSRKGKKKERER